MILSRSKAVAAANKSKTNKVGGCQKWVREIFGAPSVGDFDGDGDADAVDGWKSEGKNQVKGDRNPPAGVPVAYSGGSHGFGHRAISLGNGMIRSTDANGAGRVNTVPLDWPEKTWGLTYLGWSKTIDGQPIPDDTAPPAPVPPKTPTEKTSRGVHVDAAIASLTKAKKQKGDRGVSINKALEILMSMPLIK